MTRITASGGMLFVDTLEYVDGEEHDAKLLFSGEALDSRILDIATSTVISEESPSDTTEQPEDTAEPDPAPEQEPEASAPQEPAANEQQKEPETKLESEPSKQPETGSGSSAQTGTAVGTTSSNTSTTSEDVPPEVASGTTYVLNTSSKKFHRPNCSSVKVMSADNRQDYTGDRDTLISWGYLPCKNCDP